MDQPCLPLRIDYRALNAHCRKDTRKGDWTKAQETRYFFLNLWETPKIWYILD